MKQGIFTLLALLCISASAQMSRPYKAAFFMAAGPAKFGTGDNAGFSLRNELCLRPLSWLGVMAGTSVSHAQGGRSVIENGLNGGELQLRLQLPSLPNDLYIGAGPAFARSSNTYVLTEISQGNTVLRELEQVQEWTYGLSLGAGYAFRFYSRYLLGGGVWINSFRNGDIASGITLRFGIALE
ncbi:MAG: hypothetical protein EAZ89_06065 [Bacteroidetes bacterium]|nr:MAG: hypothetical protein EAZ89_06065 [Bacteroidota bacterium]